MKQHPTLDYDQLENIQHTDGGIRARCPACASKGSDGTGEHLFIFPDGRFGCATHSQDRAHRSLILKLAGTISGRGQQSNQRPVGEFHNIPRERAVAAAIANLPSIISRNADPKISLLLGENPHPFQELHGKCGPIRFLSALYNKEDIIWTGETNESGYPKHSRRWRSLAGWITSAKAKDERIGPFVTPGVWRPDVYSRSKSNVVRAPYVVFDFDEIDGKKAETPAEVSELFHRSIAIIRWTRQEMRWSLAAILQTGNKSLHAWFHHPPATTLASIKPVAKVFGIDPTLIDNPAQPCRLPWQVHPKSGKVSRVLWLQDPREIPHPTGN